MNNFDLISVILPVYNVDKYLPRCLDSICNSTYKNLEIICVNDGSSDASLSILEKYAEHDKRIIIIDQENKKTSAARNAGLDIAKGRWIAFIDPDDWIHSQYFEILLKVAEQTNAQIAICESLETHDDILPDKPFESDRISYKTITKKEIDQMHVVRSRVWGKLYRKDIINERRFISGTDPIEDMFFNTLLFNDQIRYGYTDSVLYYYYMREGSAIHTYTGRHSLVYTRHMIPLIGKENDSAKRVEMIKRCYNNLLSSRYLEMFSADCKEINKTVDAEMQRLRPYRRYLSMKDRLLYAVLCNFPGLYRAWRIHDDPTLLQYEAKQKKRQ